MNYYFEYEIQFYSEDVNRIEERRGIICADSFRDAVADLENFYGKDLSQIDRLSIAMDGVYEINSTINEGKFTFLEKND